MALFLDSANLDEIRAGMELGIYAGVTTNPLLMSEITPGDRLEHYGEIARICRKSIYLQVDGRSISEMLDQALTLVEVAPGRTIIKVPMTTDGLQLCQKLRSNSVPACVTAVFAPTQAFAAASAGAHAVALYVGRLNRRGEDGVEAVKTSKKMLQASELETSVIAASIPDTQTLVKVLSIPGVDATIPFRLQESMLHDKGTLEAIEEFGRATRKR